jgi:hypothetical protein
MCDRQKCMICVNPAGMILSNVPAAGAILDRLSRAATSSQLSDSTTSPACEGKEPSEQSPATSLTRGWCLGTPGKLVNGLITDQHILRRQVRHLGCYHPS